MMNFNNVACALLGATASLCLILPEIKKVLGRKMRIDKLKIVREALQQAEERVTRYEERYDKILEKICSFYLINQNLEEAFAGARDTMNEALELVVALRKLQLETIASFS